MNYSVSEGTERIMSLAFRKRIRLTSVVMPEGLLSIGDAAFSHCKALTKVTIPSTVESIGVAAFCASGLESVTFLGVPLLIERSAFIHCDNLRHIYIPAGTTSQFAKWIDVGLLTEKPSSGEKQAEDIYHPQPGKVIKTVDLFGNESEIVEQPNLFAKLEFEDKKREIEKRSRLTYNNHDFSWAKGDRVMLSELFSGPTKLVENPSFQFRKRCLFVFVKDKLLSLDSQTKEYTLPANTTYFRQKYQEKYGGREIRIFVFVCEERNDISFFDEVKLIQVGENNLQVKTVL